MPESSVVKGYVRATPGMEIPCLNNMSMLLSFQNAHIFSRARQKGWTSGLLYQMRNSRKVVILWSPQTCWQCW